MSTVLNSASIELKLHVVESEIHALLCGENRQIPIVPARDLPVCRLSELPDKPKLSTPLGQARLLHDLASIELQAMELALRTLIEFPNAQSEFRAQLAEIALGEARHLRACLKSLESLGAKWGDWPTHLALWQATSASDSLLDRVLIVHRYLEGSGLDAGDSILRRLSGIASCKAVRETMEMIVREEIGHVLFGSQWYVKLCHQAGIEPGDDFAIRLARIVREAPRRERLNRDLRQQAGFTLNELDWLEAERQKLL